MQDGRHENCVVADFEKDTVWKMAQPHATDILKADGKVKRVFRGGEHGMAHFVNEPDGHIGIALVIPEDGFLDSTTDSEETVVLQERCFLASQALGDVPAFLGR